EFFKVLEKYSKELSSRKGEMFCGKYSEVFPDVASSRIWIKKSLRKYENELLAFEKFSAINSISDGSCPGELRECWKKVLFFAFHDVSPGTGMDEGYDEAKQHIGFLDTKLTHLNMSALKSIIDWDKPKKRNDEISGDVVVFNSLSWEVSNWVEVEIDFDQGKVFKVEGLKNGVEETEVEVMKFTRYWDESLKSVKLGFVANVPATGYKIYKIVEKLSKCKTISGINISGNTIKTKFFELKFSPDTGLIEVFKGGKKICKGNDLIIDSEVGDLYYHRELIKTPIRTESGEGVKYGSFNVTNFWIKKSPLRRIINIETDYYSLRWPYRLADKLKPLIWRHKFMEFKKKIII
ncbi:MAG: glycoside hydrolase, partial [Candidatus Aenigmarchaeota archaeon]|nr:glycoside hydrolase [Candidatus Aenigmarchaeota archaeon]